MSSRTLAQLGIAVLLLGISATMVLRSCSRPHIDLNPYQALGTVAAEEASRLCGGKGRVVLVIPDPGPDPDPVLDAQLAAFKKSLKRLGGVEIKAIEVVAMDPLMRMQTGGAMPPAQFAAVRAKHADAAALVLFLAFLAIPDAEPEQTGRGSSKLMVISAALPGYDALVRHRVIDLAIVPRPMAADATPAPPNSVRAAFDREYVILRNAPADGPGGN